LKNYFTEYKPFLFFLAKFIGTYLILTFAYQSYLDGFDAKKLEVDGVTELVAEQSKQLLSLFDSNSYTKPNLKEPSVNLFYHNKWVARIIEGCNAMSVIILFVSFVFAFTGKFKQTIVFTLVGSLIIYTFNIIRIALLCMAIFHYKHYQDILHGVIFPLFIYGIVFILWVIWVNKYSLYAKK
jgi:exosortase family protein XrtF